MKENLNLEIKNVKSIHEANIEINKINVIGGVNGSGKSTVSKLFYSFLKANSENRKYYLHKDFIDCLNYHIKYLTDEKIDIDNIPECLTLEDDLSTINEKFEKISAIFDKNEEIMNKVGEESSKLILDKFNEILDDLEEKNENVDIFRECSSVKDIFNRDNMRNFRKIMKENDLMEYYGDLHNLYSKYRDVNRFNSKKRSLSSCQKLMDKYYQDDDSSISELIMNIILKKEYFRGFSYNNKKSDSIINFFIGSDEKNLNAFDYFFENEFINPVFYMDNVSILDFEEHISKVMPLHKSELIEKLYSKELSFPKKDNDDEKLKNILDKIEGIINGEYFFEGHIFTTNIPSSGDDFIAFSTSEDDELKIGLMGDNISSGTKQIGIIQILLLNNILKENDFLILDEPEVNLHPRWQFKFAEILVLLAKELNISLYINSHSPMFIESIDAFCGYYDMEDDINYYLTEKSEEKFKYNFTKINSNELYKIYDNLGSPYKLINQLKLRKKLNK